MISLALSIKDTEDWAAGFSEFTGLTNQQSLGIYAEMCGYPTTESLHKQIGKREAMLADKKVLGENVYLKAVEKIKNQWLYRELDDTVNLMVHFNRVLLTHGFSMAFTAQVVEQLISSRHASPRAFPFPKGQMFDGQFKPEPYFPKTDEKVPSAGYQVAPDVSLMRYGVDISPMERMWLFSPISAKSYAFAFNYLGFKVDSKRYFERYVPGRPSFYIADSTSELPVFLAPFMFDNPKFGSLIPAFKCFVEHYQNDSIQKGRALLVAHRPHAIRKSDGQGMATIWGLAYENGQWAELPLYMGSKSIDQIFSDAFGLKDMLTSTKPLKLYDEDLKLITAWGMSQIGASGNTVH